MKIEYILDVFYYNGELSRLWTFSTGANIASDMLFINNSFRLLTYISWILVQNNRIWGCFWKSFFWFGEYITFDIASTCRFWPGPPLLERRRGIYIAFVEPAAVRIWQYLAFRKPVMPIRPSWNLFTAAQYVYSDA